MPRRELTEAKARQILHDRSVRGVPLTEAQRGFFGARASGYPPMPIRRNPSEEAKDQDTLEGMIDRWDLSAVLYMIGAICEDKADHIASSYDDRALARDWRRAGDVVRKCAESPGVMRVT